MYCEGCYLTPKQRKQKNPKLSMHLNCFLEMQRANSEINVVLKFLRENSGDIQLLKDALSRIDNFWNRMEQAKKLRESSLQN
jgi:hypothetical protein